MSLLIEKIYAYADGACSGNPGPAACAWVLLTKQNPTLESFLQKKIRPLAYGARFLGHSTNNQAEYHGLIFALENLNKLTFVQAEVYMDSQLVIRQMQGSAQVKNKILQPLYERALRLMGNRNITFHHIPRHQNELADYLAKKELSRHKYA
ncbi:MAG: ribonuclease HI family protein [Leptospiraceae bacterium]|nr:ribonuclease HI family protein [Leptospiraceae bacterium]MDW8307114.1 ribonuclease HI family protein [Leptospiraceae bacterium]